MSILSTSLFLCLFFSPRITISSRFLSSFDLNQISRIGNFQFSQFSNKLCPRNSLISTHNNAGRFWNSWTEGSAVQLFHARFTHRWWRHRGALSSTNISRRMYSWRQLSRSLQLFSPRRRPFFVSL